MKKILSWISVVALAASASADNYYVDAIESFYIRADVGASVPYVRGQTGTKFYSAVGLVFGGGVGYRFNESIRSDINFQYSHFNKGNGNGLSVKTVLLNGYYDFVNDTIFTPYFTAGVGFSSTNSEKSFNDGATGARIFKKDSQRGVAWDVGLGSKVELSDSFDLDFCYKFISLGKTIDNNTAYANQVTGGVLFKF